MCVPTPTTRPEPAPGTELLHLPRSWDPHRYHHRRRQRRRRSTRRSPARRDCSPARAAGRRLPPAAPVPSAQPWRRGLARPRPNPSPLTAARPSQPPQRRRPVTFDGDESLTSGKQNLQKPSRPHLAKSGLDLSARAVERNQCSDDGGRTRIE